MEAQIGYLGATQQTWRGDLVRLAVLRIREANPRIGRKEIYEILAQAARDDDDLLMALASYAGNNACNSLEDAERRAAERAMPQRREAQKVQERQLVESVKSQILQLNQEMPNGKRMRYCTGPEMEKFGTGYRKIARKVGKKRVGEVLSEQQVRELLR